MRVRPFLASLLLSCAALPVVAQAPAGLEYDLQITDKAFSAVREPPGKPKALYVTVQFKLARAGDRKLATELGGDEKVVVEEDGKPVAEFQLAPPKANALTTVLAMDVSGSMASNGKIEEARAAADVFFDKLD